MHVFDEVIIGLFSWLYEMVIELKIVIYCLLACPCVRSILQSREVMLLEVPQDQKNNTKNDASILLNF